MEKLPGLMDPVSPSLGFKRARNDMHWTSDDEDDGCDVTLQSLNKRIVVSTPGSDSSQPANHPQTPAFDTDILPYGMGPMVEDPSSPSPPRRIIRRDETAKLRQNVGCVLEEVRQDLSNFDQALPWRLEQVRRKLDTITSLPSDQIKTIGLAQDYQYVEALYQEKLDAIQREVQQNRTLDAWLRR